MIKITLLATLLGITGCASSPIYKDVNKNKTNMVIKPLESSQNLQLTYRFKNSLIAEEQNQFNEYLGSDAALKDLSPALNNTLNFAGSLSKETFMYTTLWEDAFLTGDVSDLVSTSLLVGATVALISPSRERNKQAFEYYVNSIDYNVSSTEDLTSSLKKQTVNEIYAFAKAEGYSITCDFGCENSTQTDATGNHVLFLNLNDKHTTSYFRPNFILVSLVLDDLIKIEKPIDAPLLGDVYDYRAESQNGWQVYMTTTIDNVKPTFKEYITPQGVNTGRKYIVGTHALGSSIHKRFYKHLTKNLQGFSYFAHDFNNELAFYDGEVYQLNEKLTDNSIIKGLIQ